jgi:hypothetical protein
METVAWIVGGVIAFGFVVWAVVKVLGNRAAERMAANMGDTFKDFGVGKK